MANFNYTALENGSRVSGSIEAASQNAARTKLSSAGKVVLKIAESKQKNAGAKTNEGLSFGEKLLSFFMIRKSSVEISLRQLSSVLAAGVPIMTALGAVGKQAPGMLKKVYSRISQKVRQGYSLKKSFTEDAPFLGQVILGLITVGEANGTLDEMLKYSASLMERSRKVKAQIIQAFTYPVFVILGAMGVGYYMVAEVFPQIMKFILQQGNDVQLPLPTRILIQANDFLTAYGVYILVAPFALIALFFWARSSKQLGTIVDCAVLKMPVLGKAFKDYSNAMWCRTLGALLGSGVDIISAIELVQQTMGNKYYAAQFVELKQKIRQGGSLTSGIETTALHKLYPMSLTMVSVSETSGNLDESLGQVATYAEEQLTRRVAFLSKMVEPAIFIVVGGMVGFIYFAFFMAMLTATKNAT